VHHDSSVASVAENFARRNVVGMGVGVDGIEKPRRDRFREPKVLFDLVLLGVDDDAGLLLVAAQNVRETAARADLFEKNILATQSIS
jgi:hypothetical protein